MHSPLPMIKKFFQTAKNMVKRKGKSKPPTPARTDSATTSAPVPIQNDDAPMSPSFTTGSMVTCAEGSWSTAPSDIHEVLDDVAVESEDIFPSEEASWDEEPEENYHEYFWEEIEEFPHAERDVENDIDAVATALCVEGLMLASCSVVGSSISGIDLFNRYRFETLPSIPPSELDEDEMETMPWHVNMPLEQPQEQEDEKTSMSLMQTISNTWSELK
ncbi:hypothetical protein OCU04_010815 [Sclerotinia nivalis]|uniref:Uncharacterized protein n=1 Tax=Sclerotinia nivalis TaxID=352851 RepID=A0A9X0AGH4_9HELO|nr:hypothetical protein OCU04_010815 [Sclerotinia nivalis]